MNDDYIPPTREEINEALASMLRDGLIETFINEDGEQVFRLTPKGRAEGRQ